MGPSGCGKSTLLNILGLLDNPTSGKYWLDGEDVGSLKESQRTKVRKGQIGFVFQSFNLIDELNVEENVELPLTYLGVRARRGWKRCCAAWPSRIAHTTSPNSSLEVSSSVSPLQELL